MSLASLIDLISYAPGTKSSTDHDRHAGYFSKGHRPCVLLVDRHSTPPYLYQEVTMILHLPLNQARRQFNEGVKVQNSTGNRVIVEGITVSGSKRAMKS